MLANEQAPADKACTEEGWWAVYTRHQHEKCAAEVLATKGCEVFLPLYDVVRRWKDRNMKLSLPLFPGYMFVRARQEWRLPVVTTPGVTMIVCYGGKFATVSDGEIQELRRAVQGPYRIEPHPFLQCGERVRITRGALEGVEGILIRKKNLCRLVISVDMLARSAAVEVNATDVTPVRQGTGRMYSPSDLALHVPAGLAPSAAAPGSN